MSAMQSGPLGHKISVPDTGRAAGSAGHVVGERVANGRILRLVKSGPERQALESGQIDAVLDPASGNAFLLPDAQRALSLADSRIANSLLAALPRKDYQSLLGELEPVTLTSGEVLYEPGERICHVYFPDDSQVSLLMVVADRKALEVGLVGREGMVGIPLALGADASSVLALVQGSGSALRMKAASFREALGRCVPLQHEVYRYAHAKLVQARQIAACNRFHLAEARLACCLLMTRDRVRSNQFHLTHEILADTLGIRRVGVTNAAGALQRRKLISYRRGDIRILNPRGLKAASCGCYEIVRKLAL
jgi:CRP-like cAMP-binding protein